VRELTWKNIRLLKDATSVKKLKDVLGLERPTEYVECVTKNNTCHPSISIDVNNILSPISHFANGSRTMKNKTS